MGLAASQARLLSITSRMADNELRSQLINNAKMRLTAESSQVSEEYVDALNKTQLMMKNYNTAGESQYQNLTFNSLTAYSAYNNQYGLRDKSGQLLVAETDAAKFEEAFKMAEQDESIIEGDTEGLNAKALEEFLKSYGLEKSTTYFENQDVFSIDPNIQAIYEGDMVYNTDGSRVSGIHYGYELSKTSVEYGIYLELLDDYQTKSDAYTNATIKEMQQTVYDTVGNGDTYKNWYSKMSKLDADLTYDTNGETITAPADAVAQAQALVAAMQDIYNALKGHLKTTTQTTTAPDGSTTESQIPGTFANTMEEYLSMPNIGDIRYELVDTDKAYNRNPPGTPMHTDPTTGDPCKWVVYDETVLDSLPEEQLDENGLPLKTEPETAYGDGTYQEVIKSTVTESQYVENTIYMWEYFQTNIMNALKREDFSSGAEAQAAKAEYYEAAKQLSMFIFGQDVGAEYYDNLDDMEWCMGQQVWNDDIDGEGNGGWGQIFPTTALDPSEGGIVAENTITVPYEVTTTDPVTGQTTTTTVNETYQPNFQAVIDIYLCEKMMEEYGVPNYTWIDVNNPNENADAKAEWYTNLFERMMEGGYKAIENGLASSSEWLQFALESSLISMEQVNDEGDWVSTMYTNCVDITESSIDIDITRAEAEYTKAMNKIEAKDKRYDLELKNIDTEHQSLQTEYDSIKSVIDKNVERNFKYFTA